MLAASPSQYDPFQKFAVAFISQKPDIRYRYGADMISWGSDPGSMQA
jgi:hypothetical protein